MTSTQAARLVFVAAALEGGFVLLNASRNGSDRTFRALWAIGAVTLGLSVLADFVPQVAGPFALLVLVAMSVRSRGEIMAFFTGSRGSSAASSSSSSSSSAPGGTGAHR